MSRVVVDTSLAVKWLFVESYSMEARWQLVDWVQRGVDRVVPSWFGCEIANVLYRRVWASMIAVPAAQQHYRDLLQQVTIQEFEPTIGTRAIELAHLLGQQASYDSHYLALAERLGCELWTADERFWRQVSPHDPRIKWIGNVSAPLSTPSTTV
jgi:predicted nucleic acid-binding protein